MKLEKLPLISIADCFSKSDIARKLNLPLKGQTLQLISEYIIHYQLSIDHFSRNIKNKIYPDIIKECPSCKKDFTTQLGHPREKTTCSHSCANSYFRSGKDNPNFKHGSSIYRSLINVEKCNRCGYKEYPEILQVHHINRDRTNNAPENLETLCPNCHTLDHYLGKDGLFTSKFNSQTMHSTN